MVAKVLFAAWTLLCVTWWLASYAKTSVADQMDQSDAYAAGVVVGTLMIAAMWGVGSIVIAAVGSILRPSRKE